MECGDLLFDMFVYKWKYIDKIFVVFFGVKFMLIGDDGEKDLEIFVVVVEKYFECVEGVWIWCVYDDVVWLKFVG